MLRKKLNLSQEKLAERLGVSRNTISRWERGNFRPSAENLDALNKLYAELGVSAPPDGNAAAQTTSIPAPAKKWPVAIICIGILCSLLIGIISLIGIYSLHQKLEPEDTAVPMEEMPRKEADRSQWDNGSFTIDERR